MAFPTSGAFLRLSLCLCLLVAACGSPATVPRADLVLTNARVVTGTGSVLDNATVAVSRGRILTVSTDRVETPGDTVIDLSTTGYTVLPGFVDTHVHLIPSGGIDSDEALATYIAERLPGRLESFLVSGTTTIYDEGDFWPAVSQAKEKIAAGTLRGPRLFAVGLILTAPAGHPASTICRTNPYCQKNRMVQLDNPQIARETVDTLAKGGVDGIKVVHEAAGITMSREVLNAVIDQARVHGIPVDSHNETVVSSIEAVEAGVTRLVHPPRFGGVDGTPFVGLVVDRGVRIAATVGSGGPGNPNYNPEMATLFQVLKSNVQAIRSRNVLLSFGTDNAGGAPADRVWMEAQALRDIGLSPAEILSMMTRDSAIYLGREKELGTIEAGKLADLVIVSGNPLEDLSAIRNVVVVVKDGALVVDKR
jgi:imidazolonepropionase-like amidohydrolase